MDKSKLLDWIARQPQDSRNACRQLLDSLNRVERGAASACTLFLSPEVAQAVPSLVAHFPQLYTALLPEGCERRILCISHEPIDSDSEVDITVLEIHFDEPIQHKDILGATLATGMNRDRMGDIRIGERRAEMMVKSGMADFLIDTLGQIGRTPVRVANRHMATFSLSEGEAEVLRVIVSSERLDAVVAQLTHTSREKAQTRIRRGEVKLNHLVDYQTSRLMQPGDTLSIRGFGRYNYRSVDGATKKGNRVLLIEHKK